MIVCYEKVSLPHQHQIEGLHAETGPKEINQGAKLLK